MLGCFALQRCRIDDVTDHAIVVADVNGLSPGKHGIHRYAPEEFGVDPHRVRAAFGDYIDHFSLAPEEL